MFKPNIVTSGLLMTGNKIKVVKKKKNPKETSAAPVSNTMFATPKKLSYNDPAAVLIRAEERSSQRQQDQSAANKRKANPMTDREMGKKVKESKKFYKKVRKNQGKSTSSANKRKDYNTGGADAEREKAAKKEAKGCGLSSPGGSYTGNVCKQKGSYYKKSAKKMEKRSEVRNPGLKKSPKPK